MLFISAVFGLVALLVVGLLICVDINKYMYIHMFKIHVVHMRCCCCKHCGNRANKFDIRASADNKSSDS